MKTLYLTRNQALNLANDLHEYVNFKDSSGRELFKGFRLSFGDTLANNLQPDESFEMRPISEYTEISE